MILLSIKKNKKKNTHILTPSSTYVTAMRRIHVLSLTNGDHGFAWTAGSVKILTKMDEVIREERSLSPGLCRVAMKLCNLSFSSMMANY